jgi:hypothetical protein
MVYTSILKGVIAMRFIPGQSGNPTGRPPGSLNKKTLAFEAAYEDKAEQAVQDIMERAKGGDPAAMRLCMERAVPTGRNRRLAFALPRIKTPEDAEAAIDVVMDALAEGVLTLAEVSELLRLVERLLGLAESILKVKKLRAIFGDGPPVEPYQEDAPQEPAPGLAAGGATPAEGHGEAAAPLYSPVNLAADEAAEAIEPTGGPPAHIGPGDNGPLADAHGPPADADQAMPPQRAAA